MVTRTLKYRNAQTLEWQPYYHKYCGKYGYWVLANQDEPDDRTFCTHCGVQQFGLNNPGETLPKLQEHSSDRVLDLTEWTEEITQSAQKWAIYDLIEEKFTESRLSFETNMYGDGTK